MNVYNITQESVAQDYATSGVFKKKTDAGDLHMFFSPFRIPIGLTDEQVGICLGLYKRKSSIQDRLREEQQIRLFTALKKGFEEDYCALERSRESFSLMFGEGAMEMSAEEIADLLSRIRTVEYDPIPVPPELRLSPMTEESFQLGIRALTDRMDLLSKK